MPPEKPAEAPDEPVDAEVVLDATGVPPELREAVKEAVEDAMSSTAMVVADPRDEHEAALAMDAHDAARFLDGLVTQAQERNMGKKWVYEIDSKTRGLTGDAVEDITQAMNWTGRARIAVLPETLQVESIDGEDGLEWQATVFARDELSGATFVGTSAEPQQMSLREGGKKYDRFARTKAVNKAERNALEKHIPTIVKVTLVALAARNPALVEHVQTKAEAAAAELPPPLDTPEAKKLISEIEAVYDEIRELGGGKGRVLFPPGEFGAYMLRSQHDMDRLGQLHDFVVRRREAIGKEVEA